MGSPPATGAHPLLEGCSQGQLETVAELSTLRTYQPDGVLIEEAAPSAALFAIVDGSVVVTGDDGVLATLGRGSVLGESEILDWWVPPKGERSRCETGRRTATVAATAEAPVDALAIDPAGFERRRDEVPEGARRLGDETRTGSAAVSPHQAPGRAEPASSPASDAAGDRDGGGTEHPDRRAHGGRRHGPSCTPAAFTRSSTRIVATPSLGGVGTGLRASTAAANR